MSELEGSELVLKDPLIKRLHAYWSSRRLGRALPARSALDPLEMKFVLGNLVLAEVHRDPLRFRYRVHGVNLVDRDGYDMTGKWLHEHPEPDYSRRIIAAWTSVVETARPFSAMRDFVVDHRIRRYEVVVLPLGENGATVDMLLSAQVHIDESP